MKIPKGYRLLKSGTLIRATDKIWMWGNEWLPWGFRLKRILPKKKVIYGKFIRRIKRKTKRKVK